MKLKLKNIFCLFFFSIGMAATSPEFMSRKRKIPADPESSDGEETPVAEFSVTQTSKSLLSFVLFQSFIYMCQDKYSILSNNA